MASHTFLPFRATRHAVGWRWAVSTMSRRRGRETVTISPNGNVWTTEPDAAAPLVRSYTIVGYTVSSICQSFTNTRRSSWCHFFSFSSFFNTVLDLSIYRLLKYEYRANRKHSGAHTDTGFIKSKQVGFEPAAFLQLRRVRLL